MANWEYPKFRLPAIGAAAILAFAALTALPGASPQAQPSPIQHVVVIYMENHSFDNILGFWCNTNPGRCPDGGMPASVTLSNGAVVRPSTDGDIVPPADHSVQSQQAALNVVGGVPQMNGWQNILGGTCAAPRYRCISGYRPSQIPDLITLAQNFAISDRTFSMADSPSWGGHLYAVMASNDGFIGDNPIPATGVTPGPGWGCDSSKTSKWLAPDGTIHMEPSCIPDYSLGLADGGAFRPTPVAYHATILDELDKAGLSWRIYGQASPGTAKFGASGWIWSICPSLAECLNTGQRAGLVDNSQFFTDAAAGTLPAFSVVTGGGTADGGYTSSCHNAFSMTACDNYIGQLVQAVENGPDWSSTAIFITFDDCGCFYDQVPPPLAPDMTREGPRVPLIIVSPYARPGFTDTTSASFAGILAYAEHNFGLGALGPNDNFAYDFSGAFNYSQAPLKPARMVTRPLPPAAKQIRVAPALMNDPT